SAIHAHLFGAPIAAKFSSSAQEISGMEASGTTVKIVAAVLVLIMMSTTFLTQQQMIQKFMLYGVPFFTLTSGWYFPIGVIIYWVTNNLITMGQQFWVLHKYPPPKVATKSGTSANGAKATPAKSSGGLFAAFRAAREAAGGGATTSSGNAPVGRAPAKPAKAAK